MKIAAILCEYNPLHDGHRRHIALTKAAGFDAVAAVMSGNFVQRGDVAVYDKWIRAKAAIDAGINLVVEVPTSCVLQSAQGYAEAGVTIMAALGASAISFGSECGDVDLLMAAARRFSQSGERIKEEMAKGFSYPVARQVALDELGRLLNKSNNTLGIEYCAAIEKFNLPISPFTVLRPEDSIRASVIRETLSGGDDTHELKHLDRAILARLRTLPPSYFATLPDVTEGLENRIVATIRSASSFFDVVYGVSTKRYTLARIRRILLRAFLDVPNIETPAQLRVLALDNIGREIIKGASLPVVTKAANANFETEGKCTDLYALSRLQPDPCGLEYTKEVYYLDN